MGFLKTAPITSLQTQLLAHDGHDPCLLTVPLEEPPHQFWSDLKVWVRKMPYVVIYYVHGLLAKCCTCYIAERLSYPQVDTVSGCINRLNLI